MTKGGNSKGYLSYWSWIEELAKILSTYTSKKRSWRILIFKTENGYELYHKRKKSSKHIGTFDVSNSPRKIHILKKKLRKIRGVKEEQVVLRLSPGFVLQKSIKLPSGAEEVLEQVIRNQMRRLVPWPENDTCFTYKKSEVKQKTGEINVNVIAASKSSINSSIDELFAINIQPAFAEYSESANDSSSLELISLKSDNIEQNRRLIHRAIIATSIICFAIAIGGVWQLSDKLVSFYENKNRLQSANNTISFLKRKNNDNLRIANLKSFLIRRKDESVPVVLVLEGLSKTLPDNAWLQKMEIAGRKISISGKARNATGLVQTLERSSMMKKVNFSAPSVRIGLAGVETFSILADLVVAEESREMQQ